MTGSQRLTRKLFAGLVGLALPLSGALAQPPTKVEAKVESKTDDGCKCNYKVTLVKDAPTVTLTLGPRCAKVVPLKDGLFARTGGGNITVAQPSDDSIVITLTGAAAATGSPTRANTAALDFDLSQCFEVVFASKDVKAAKLSIEGQLIGLLRSEARGGGTATVGGAVASVGCEGGELVTLSLPGHTAAGGTNLSINDHDGPFCVPVACGKYNLHAAFHVSATYPRAVLPCRAASAEFAPPDALDPHWISPREPFHGAKKDELGFQITIKVAEVTIEEAANGNGNGATTTTPMEVVPPPTNK